MLGSRLLTKILTDFLFGIYLLNYVLKHATKHIQTRWHKYDYNQNLMKKTKLILLLIILTSIECYSQQNGDGGTIKHTAIKSGIGLGSVLAVVVSWERNKSVLLAFLHGIFSWLYVIYFVLTRKPEERK